MRELMMMIQSRTLCICGIDERMVHIARWFEISIQVLFDSANDRFKPAIESSIQRSIVDG